MTKNNIDISLNKDYENIIIKDNDNQINNKIEYDNFMDNEIEDNNIHEIINTIYNNTISTSLSNYIKQII